MRACVTATGVWLGLALLVGCGGSGSLDADATVKNDLLDGIAQIRTTRTVEVLYARLTSTLTKLRRDRASTPAGRHGRRVAIQGFELTRKGVKAQLDFVSTDSGNVEAATRDAIRADRYLNAGARRLRAAGRALGIQVGKIRGR